MSGPSPAVRDAVLRRDDGRCVVCFAAVAVEDGDRMRPLSGWYSLQHRVARGMGGRSVINDAHNLLTVCGTGTTGCHGRIEGDPVWAAAQGYRVASWDSPETVPVAVCLTPGMYGWFVLDDDRRVALDRHHAVGGSFGSAPRRADVDDDPRTNPDCRDGKHAACSGGGWDMSADRPCPCRCTCHAAGHHPTDTEEVR